MSFDWWILEGGLSDPKVKATVDLLLLHHNLMDDDDDVHRHDVGEEEPSSSDVSCSICLDLVSDNGGRSRAKLQCGHEFHLGITVFVFPFCKY